MEKIITLEAEIVADTKLVIEGAAEVKIDASKSITAEIAPDTYVLGSVGSFDTASGWVGEYVNELVRESIGTGGTLADALDLLRTDVLGEIELGVNQVITQVENEYVSNSTLTTTLGSELGAVNSSILNIENTYATQDQAQAYAIDAIKSSFGGNSSSSAIEAYIGSIAITQVDADSALASTVDVLTAIINDTSIRIDTLDSVEITPEGWSLGASKLATDGDNNIVGWQFSNGSNAFSEFNVFADHFKVASGTSALAPFRVDTVEGKVYFNAEVEFEGLGINGGSTSIDGGKITTGSIDANSVKANTIWTDGSVQSSDFTTVGGAGFRLKANAAGTSADPTIYGAFIAGGEIDATTDITSPTIYSDKLYIRAENYLNNFGSSTIISLNYSLVDVQYMYSDIFYSNGYSSGYLFRRCTKASPIFFIEASGRAGVGAYDYTQVPTVYYSINGAAWALSSVGTLSVPLNGSYTVQFRSGLTNGATLYHHLLKVTVVN